MKTKVMFLLFVLVAMIPATIFAGGEAFIEPNAGRAWGPAPTVEQADGWQGVGQSVLLIGEPSRTAVLKEVIMKYWYVKDFNVQKGTGHRVHIVGIAGREDVEMSDKLIKDIKKMISNPNTGMTPEKLCPTQWSQIRSALGSYTTYYGGKCPDCGPRVLTSCKDLGYVDFEGRSVKISACKANDKDEGAVAGKWNYAPGWEQQVVVYLNSEPPKGRKPIIPADHPVWSHLRDIRGFTGFPPDPKRWQACKYRLFPATTVNWN